MLPRLKSRVASLLLTTFALLGTSGGAFAHPVPFSYLDLRLRGSDIEGSLVAHIADLAHDLKIEPPERLLEPSAASAQGGAIPAMFSQRLSILVDGRAVSLQWSEVEVIPERQSLRLRFQIRTERAPGRISVGGDLFPYDPSHRTFVNIYEGEALIQAILDWDRPRFDYYAGTAQGKAAVVSRFLPAGIEHILIGPDHILFLVGLLLPGGSLRRLALIVTAFTLAHTITLSLAALSVINPPASFIEPAIALSIVYVGADNLLRRGGRDARAWIAFAFGFIHGFGFAYVLREMDLPSRSLGWSLFSFNLGVEVGQLLIVAVVASALGVLRSRSEIVARRLAFAGSWAVVGAGAFWYIQRVFFPGGI
ncbi:MAG: HupE/UreJ family protein [Vicinamibacteria bacterium]|nr:HupE/UreJ family protein [Vicinamibacteria bacterium]